jgi:hypothetical protein
MNTQESAWSAPKFCFDQPVVFGFSSGNSTNVPFFETSQ